MQLDNLEMCALSVASTNHRAVICRQFEHSNHSMSGSFVLYRTVRGKTPTKRCNTRSSLARAIRACTSCLCISRDSTGRAVVGESTTVTAPGVALPLTPSCDVVHDLSIKHVDVCALCVVHTHAGSRVQDFRRTALRAFKGVVLLK